MKLKDILNRTHEFNSFMGWTISESKPVDNFSLSKYPELKVENTMYVYDKDGYLMAVVNHPTLSGCRNRCRRYIFKKRVSMFFSELFNQFKKSAI